MSHMIISNLDRFISPAEILYLNVFNQSINFQCCYYIILAYKREILKEISKKIISKTRIE